MPGYTRPVKKKSLKEKLLHPQNIGFFSLLVILLVLPVTIFFLQQQQTVEQHASGTCNDWGVTQGFDGSYSFARLAVDSSGNVVDANNPGCMIHLVGLNQGWFTSGVGGGPDATEFDWYKQHLHYNIIRVAFNSRWWKDSTQDPSKQTDIDYQYGIDLRDALINYVHLAESKGFYVELDLDSQFVHAPCDLQHQQCTQASQGAQDWETHVPGAEQYYHDPTGQELSAYQPTALWTLNDIATTFKNDPAVLFDVWNEPAKSETKMPDPSAPTVRRIPITEEQFYQDMQDRVSAVSSVAPNSMIIVYSRALTDMMSTPSAFPVFTQKNIMYDVHIYSKKWMPSDTQPMVDFAHQHGQAFVVGEWGGVPEEPTAQLMEQFLMYSPSQTPNNVNATYFSGNDLRNGSKNNPVWNQTGIDVESAYFAILGLFPPSVTPTYAATPTFTPTPTPFSISATPTPTPFTITPTPPPGCYYKTECPKINCSGGSCPPCKGILVCTLTPTVTPNPFKTNSGTTR